MKSIINLKPYIFLYGFGLAFSAFILAILPYILDLGHLYFTLLLRISFYTLLLPVLTCYLLTKGTPLSKKYKLFSLFIALIFSQFISIGQSYKLCNSFNAYGSFLMSILIWILESIIWTLILYPILKRITWWFETRKFNTSLNHKYNINYKYLFLITAGIRAVCLIFFFPCIFDYDAAFSLRTMIRPFEVISNHHPYFVQYIQAFFYKLGVSWFNRPEIGMAMLSGLWIIISSIIVIYATRSLELVIKNSKLSLISGYFLSLFPIFPILSLAITKDGFFAYGMLLYTSCLLTIYSSNGKKINNFSFQLLFLLSIIFICFTRNQGVYIIFISFIYLLWIYRNYWLKLTIINLIPIFLIYWTNSYYFPSIDVQSDSKKEAYNILFQQTARYLKSYPNDITKEESKAISTILNIDTIAKVYKPEITDPVKTFYNYGRIPTTHFNDTLQHFPRWIHDGENEAIRKYQKAWLSMFIRHPDSYIDAHLSIIWPFFFPGKCPVFYIESAWPQSTATSPEYSFPVKMGLISKICLLNEYFLNLPLFNLFFSAFFYVWLALYLIFLLVWRKDWKGLSIFMPILLSLLFLLICPVATTRYIYPFLILIPLLFVYLLKINYNGK